MSSFPGRGHDGVAENRGLDGSARTARIKGFPSVDPDSVMLSVGLDACPSESSCSRHGGWDELGVARI